MYFKWIPWKFLISHIARKQGFLDPFSVLANVGRFGKPAEVFVPVELLRSAFMLHARGLVNSQAIQHNLDWVWPYWVVRQFNPRDESFVPRAFSLTHINLTQRNWTAIGVPGCDTMPVVDPRGLVTPFYDGWSIDAWLVGGKEDLVPSRASSCEQYADTDKDLKITTGVRNDRGKIKTEARVIEREGVPVCVLDIEANSKDESYLAIGVRPYNPEGVSFIKKLRLHDGKKGWKINNRHEVILERMPDSYKFSNYKKGDVYGDILSEEESDKITCDVGMCTGSALYKIIPQNSTKLSVLVPLRRNKKVSAEKKQTKSTRPWSEDLTLASELDVKDKKTGFLYKNALKTLLLHSQRELYAGPYTYKRFWFRDAVFIVHAMLCCGLIKKSEEIIDSFMPKQKANGYFCSQNGEWDSNGQVLWLINRFSEIAGEKPKDKWMKAMKKGAVWLSRKINKNDKEAPHADLLPAGFSAEHLGPNDYYYWDNFWAIAGLKGAARLLDMSGEHKSAVFFNVEASSLMRAIEKSLVKINERSGRPAMPASPYRRLDSGSIGSLAVGYPLQLWPSWDKRLADTIEYLLDNCMVDNGFFHDMSHSGINPYLTLHIAQVLLRKNDMRFYPLVKTIRDLATSTGQWPEAIHPRTKGGCMGDGQHVWAASEWLLMTRNRFVREEGEYLVVGSGVTEELFNGENVVCFRDLPTSFGTVDVSIKKKSDSAEVECKGRWHNKAPVIKVSLPGYREKPPEPGSDRVTVRKNK